MRPKVLVLILWTWLFVGLASALAQQPPVPPGMPGRDPIAENLFPPDLIMSQGEAISLNQAQKTFIQSEVLKAQGQFVELQPRLQEAMQTLVGLVQQSRVNESQLLEQLDKVLKIEREIKRAQLGLMVRIKNELTSEQQARLRQLRAQSIPR